MKIYVDKVNKVGVFDVHNDKPVLANHVLLNEYLPGWFMKRLSNVYLNCYIVCKVKELCLILMVQCFTQQYQQ